MKYCRGCRHSARWVFLLPAFVLPLVFAARPAPAQEGSKYDVIEPERKQKLFEIKLSPLFLRGKFDPGEEEAMVAYFTQYFFPCWTDPKFYPPSCPQLPDLRHKLHLHLSNAGRAPAKEVHDRLNAVTLDFLTKLATGNYSPAVRINAMLMIGELNALEVAPPRNKSQPLAEALPVLLKNADDSKQLEAVRVAAMVGVVRRAAAGLNEADEKKVTAAMLKLLKAPVPEGPVDDGYAWLQAQAADALGRLHSVGQDGEIAYALAAIVGDAKTSFDTRCATAQALGNLNYDAGSVNGATVLAALCHMALDAASTEAEGPSVSPRRLKWRMHCVELALTGISGLIPASYHPSAEALKDTADRLMNLNPENDKDLLLQEVGSGRRELDKLMQNLDKQLQKPTK